MPNQTPLNPEALKAALAWFAQAVAEVEVKHADQGTRPGDYWTGYRAAKNEIADLLAEPKLIEKATNAGLAVAQPVVNSVEELDRLPMHSYVQGNDGFKHAKDWAGGWHLIVNRPSSAPHLSGSIDLPARVLYRPEVKL